MLRDEIALTWKHTGRVNPCPVESVKTLVGGRVEIRPVEAAVCRSGSGLCRPIAAEWLVHGQVVAHDLQLRTDLNLIERRSPCVLLTVYIWSGNRTGLVLASEVTRG